MVETYLNIDGYPVILADTAGIRKAKNKVEKEGIKRAIKKAKEADSVSYTHLTLPTIYSV